MGTPAPHPPAPSPVPRRRGAELVAVVRAATGWERVGVRGGRTRGAPKSNPNGDCERADGPAPRPTSRTATLRFASELRTQNLELALPPHPRPPLPRAGEGEPIAHGVAPSPGAGEGRGEGRPHAPGHPTNPNGDCEGADGPAPRPTSRAATLRSASELRTQNLELAPLPHPAAPSPVRGRGGADGAQCCSLSRGGRGSG